MSLFLVNLIFAYIFKIDKCRSKLNFVDYACSQMAEEGLSLAQRRAQEPMADEARALVQIEIETYEALVKAAQNVTK